MSEVRGSKSDQAFLGYPYYDTIWLFPAFASFALSRFPKNTRNLLFSMSEVRCPMSDTVNRKPSQ